MELSCLSLLLGFLLVFCPCRAVAYVKKFFEHDSICSANLVLNEINLNSHEDQSALVIKDSRYFQPSIGELEFDCQFTVSTSLGLGVFAVIQHMNFRRNAQGECVDYVQFRHIEKISLFGDMNFKLKVTNLWSSKICGKINNGFEVNSDDYRVSSSSDEDADKAIKNSFTSKKGLIEVKIHLGNRSITEIGKESSIEVVFTAFQVCMHDLGNWKNCGFNTCIHKNLFQDGKLNCPYKICKDEIGCRLAVIADNGSGGHIFGIKILAFIVTGVSVMLVVFIVLVWLFCYCNTKFRCKGHSKNNYIFKMRSSFMDNVAFTATAPPEADVNNYV